MNREEANREAKLVFEKWRKQKDQIEKKARKNGSWKKIGLDSNNELFKDIDFEAKEKLNSIRSLIDEE
ncbi:MAG: hypothetical protein ACLS6Q_07815 [Christensenellaceae bacterium]